MHRRCRAWVLAAVATTGAGCSLLVDFEVGVRDTDAGIDAGTDARCGSALALQDDFEGAALAAHWTTSRGGDFVADPAVVDGRLRFAFVAGGPTALEYSEVVSRVAYDLRDSAVTVSAVTVDPVWETDLELVAPPRPGEASFIAGFGQYAGTLRAWQIPPGQSFQEIASIPYVAEDHVYWRARHAGGAIRFEAAGEDRQFTLLHEVDDPRLTPDSLQIVLVASATEPGSDGFVELDDLNPGAPAVAMCPIDDLQDPFTSPQLEARWNDRGPACNYTSTGASLVMSTPAASVCQLSSIKAYSLTGSAGLTVDIAAFPSQSGDAFEVWLTSDDVTYAVVRQQGAQLFTRLARGGELFDEQFSGNAVASQRWRLTDAGGVIQIETADPGGQFAARHLIDPAGSIDLGNLIVGFSVAADGADTLVELAGVNAP